LDWEAIFHSDILVEVEYEIAIGDICAELGDDPLDTLVLYLAG
jgi:hypothetical protein